MLAHAYGANHPLGPTCPMAKGPTCPMAKGPTCPLAKGPTCPNTDIFIFGDDSYHCHWIKQKRHASTIPLIIRFCSQLSLSDSYHLLALKPDLNKSPTSVLLMIKTTFFSTQLTSLQHVGARFPVQEGRWWCDFAM